ncbi:uncharacterized protein LOC105689586 isoform X2 [Athalia rosae]|uniref:uncharacterized protein LOC105689586 isoform X2 n=1 Tax=Athalia rosae TaxID=37344 RepID=UPI0020332864|nr:uncharacterized protein LOC105689586 isoform X2 [Athalia rosae]
MNSKEDNNGQNHRTDNRDTRVEGPKQQETNDNRSTQRTEGNPRQVAKIQNILATEQFKLNNNIGEENGDENIPLMSSNGPQNSQENCSVVTAGQEVLDASYSEMLSTNMHSMNTNIPGNYVLVYAKTSSCTVPNFSTTISENGSKEDTDMRNNVDYGSGIEKCPPKVACGTDSTSESIPIWSSSSFVPNRGMNNIGSSIGSTSQGTCCFLRPNINGSREVAGPSGLQRVSQRDGERRDSSSGNEGDMSDGEDCCFYTYKGTDDPRLELRDRHVEGGQQKEQEEEPRHPSGSSSPEMDFLEMDFDPGPSCEQDTGDSDMASINEDIQNIALDCIDPDPVPLNDLSSGRVASRLENPAQDNQNPDMISQPQKQLVNRPESTFNQIPNQPGSSHWMPGTSGCSSSSSGMDKWEATGLHHRTTLCPLQESYGHHNTNGDLISPGDSRDSESELWAQDACPGAGSVPESSNLDSRKESELCNDRTQDLLPIEKVMLWSEQEATVKQVTQIATSACGATAAINALLALDVAFSLEVLVRGVATRLREPGTPLPRYLMSRSMAGATHKDLARGMSLATSGAVVTKFFGFYPERKISLSHWLQYWISRGAVPIATLNLQHCGEGANIPDAWHHQMIFGVGPAGIYLSNPLQCLPEQVVWHQLVSPSILLIRRQDVLANWSTNTDLRPLTFLDQRWRKLNVLGQVVNLVRETMGQRRQSSGITTSVTHIRIPASYRAGITFVMRSDAPAAAELLRTEQLPLL